VVYCNVHYTSLYSRWFKTLSVIGIPSNMLIMITIIMIKSCYSNKSNNFTIFVTILYKHV